MRYEPSFHIGTSGWHYAHWIGPFYPPGFPKRELLLYYSYFFNTVEINNSFYKQPADTTLDEWRSLVPAGFTFAYKASRFITHMKKLTNPHEPLERLRIKADRLGDKLGPLLFQLPPRFHYNGERFESFLRELPANYRYAFEFRDPTWYNDNAYELLSRYNVSLCIHDAGGRVGSKALTADFVYIRLHGAQGMGKKYEDSELSAWADEMVKWIGTGREVFCYFNNDADAGAVFNAFTLNGMLSELSGHPELARGIKIKE